MTTSLGVLDLVLLGIVLLSALVGVLRGLLREAMSLVVWATALWAAGHYDGWLAAQMTGVVAGEELRGWLARGFILLGVLIGGGLVTWLLSLLLQGARLTALDRSVGLVFGLMRGVVLVGLAVIGMQLLGMDAQSWWRESKLIPYAAPIADALRGAAEQGLMAAEMTGRTA